MSDLTYEQVQEQHTIGHGKELWFTELTDTGFATASQIIGTKELNTPEGELGATEFTNDQSPNFTKEYKPGLYDPGTISVTYQYAASEFAKLEELKLLGCDAETRPECIKLWKVKLPDGATSIGKGFVTSNNVAGEGEDGVEAEAEIQCSGLWEFTPPSGS